jgi:hypothetical protein
MGIEIWEHSAKYYLISTSSGRVYVIQAFWDIMAICTIKKSKERLIFCGPVSETEVPPQIAWLHQSTMEWKRGSRLQCLHLSLGVMTATPS